jgi:hypothetical protein
MNMSADRPDPKREHDLRKALWRKAETFAPELGLSNDDEVIVGSLHALNRVMPNGSLQRQLFVELLQTRNAPFDPRELELGSFEFVGGTTLIFDEKGEVQFAIAKPVHGHAGEKRCAAQRKYLRHLSDSFGLAPYLPFELRRDVSFCSLHRGY